MLFCCLVLLGVLLFIPVALLRLSSADLCSLPLSLFFFWAAVFIIVSLVFGLSCCDSRLSCRVQFGFDKQFALLALVFSCVIHCC